MYLMMEGEKTGMKKIWIGVLLIAILTGLSACGSKPEESTGEFLQTESAASFVNLLEAFGTGDVTVTFSLD